MSPYSIEEELKFKEFAKWHPTILIIDNEEGLRNVIDEMFSTLGCKVYSAGNGEECLNIYKEYNMFDLVILDIENPFRNGKTIFREIKKINPDQKILLMSGYADVKDLDDLMKSGADGFLKKPFSMYKIIGKVKDIIF